MRIAGEKTQAIVLFQWARDATRLRLKVAGAEVAGGPALRLLGVTFDRLLHFGAHCADLRRKVRPGIAHLRRMTDRSWGLNKTQSRMVANGYVRGVLEYAAGARFRAASESHLELVDCELRAAARVVTGCTVSTPGHALMAKQACPLPECFEQPWRHGCWAWQPPCRRETPSGPLRTPPPFAA